MSQVETVALWAGLISSIAGIVLSIVAMVFAIWVNNRATDINNQMIRSLQKIDSSVERVASDTRELITAAWNKMLGAMGRENDTESAESDEPDLISGGIASELRSELTEGLPQESAEKVERLEQSLKELQETVAAQLRQKPDRVRRIRPLDSLIQAVSLLPVEARALLSLLIRGHHLDREQYRMATQNKVLKNPIRALRSAGLLIPLEGNSDADKKIPVCYLPPGLVGRLRLATQFAGDTPRDVLDSTAEALREVGYELNHPAF